MSSRILGLAARALVAVLVLTAMGVALSPDPEGSLAAFQHQHPDFPEQAQNASNTLWFPQGWTG